jgi:hypothetical protein
MRRFRVASGHARRMPENRKLDVTRLREAGLAAARGAASQCAGLV